MTTDLSATSSEVVETNSLREITLFCAVLLVEIYSLAVSFGGPFFEVGYFLLVVISQTFAGAYIWAQLRQSDKTLPLPELLAMGFAIGSASAAISQLIIRDLLGIRLFLSPLVPIIGVAIWLVTKRDPQLPVKVTHATTNTLLWLLFPAPLAMSFFIWELHILFVIPIFILALYVVKSKSKRSILLVVAISTLSTIFGLIIRLTHPVSIAVGLIGFDEIMDEGFAIGFSNWGLSENIGRVGSSFAYYKFSHIWIAPILEITHSSPMIISTSVMPLVVFMFIGCALWAISHQTFSLSTPAGIASVLFFVQNALPEPDNLAIRVAQCLIIVYLLTGLTALMKKWKNCFRESIVVAVIFFVLFSTRIQFGIIVLCGYLVHTLTLLLRAKSSLWLCISVVTAISISLILSFFIFFNGPAHANGFPNQAAAFALVGILASFVGLRSFIPLLTIKQKLNKQSFLLLSIILSSTLIFFLIPLATLANAPSLTFAILASIVISKDVAGSSKALTKFQLFGTFLVASFSGSILRFSFDYYKWSDPAQINRPMKFFISIVNNGKYAAAASAAPFIAVTLLVVLTVKLLHIKNVLRPVALLVALSMSFGISLATTYRSVTNHYRYGFDLAGDIESKSPMSWYTEAERLDALAWLRDNTERDDIFAQNTSTPDYRTTAYSASLIISGASHRRAFIEGTYGAELQYDYPTDVNLQTPRLKEQLQRLDTSFNFPITPSLDLLRNLQKENVKWFVVDLANTPLRDWEPWATTRFMNEKVAILELAQLPMPSK